MKLLTSTLAVLLASFSQAYAYVLDPSCAAYKDVVVSGMKGAFDLAQAGADTFNTLASNAGSGAKREAQKDLINFIFAEALTNGNIDVTNSGVSKLLTTAIFLKKNTILIIRCSG